MIPFADNTTNNCEEGVSFNHDDNGYDSVERNLHEIRRQKAFQRVLAALGVSVGDTTKPTSVCTSNTVITTTHVLTDVKEKKCQPILGQNADEVKRLLKEQRIELQNRLDSRGEDYEDLDPLVTSRSPSREEIEEYEHTESNDVLLEDYHCVFLDALLDEIEAECGTNMNRKVGGIAQDVLEDENVIPWMLSYLDE